MSRDGTVAEAASGAGVLEAILRRDRWIVATGLVALVVLCWWYLLVMADAMRAMRGAGGSSQYMWLMPMGAWSAAEFALAALMWIVMMIGMMVPSAAPMILLYALAARRERRQGRVLPSTAIFVAGYLVVWSGFSVVAAAVQFGLTELRLMSDLMQSSSVTLSAAVLVAAGAYQLTAWKGACLAQCRSPIAFLLHHWASGPFRMGFAHGAYCLGCCWAAMCVLFAVGVMNLAWVAGLSALVLLEKTMPRGDWVARGSGVLFAAAGVYLLATPG